MTVAADNSCSSADGGRMILSPLNEGVVFAGITTNCEDHLMGGEVSEVMMTFVKWRDCLTRKRDKNNAKQSSSVQMPKYIEIFALN